MFTVKKSQYLNHEFTFPILVDVNRAYDDMPFGMEEGRG